MKKKILGLFTALFMMLSLVGCNTQGLKLINEMEKTNTWEAIEQSGTMNMTMKANGEEVKLTATYEAFSNVEDLQIEMTLVPKTVEIEGTQLDLTQGDYKFSPVKFYMDGLKMYISSSYITDVCRVAGIDATTIVDVSKDYLALDLQEAMESSGADFKALTNHNQESWDIYKHLKVEVPIKQEGRKYTIDLTGEQMVDAVFGLVMEGISSQEATLRSTYKAMGMTDEEIETLLANVKAVYNDETKAQVKPFVKDSTAQVVFDFAEDKYTADYLLNLKVSALGEEIAMDIKLTDTVKKATKKAITFPTNVRVYTMEELTEGAQGGKTVVIDKALVRAQEDQTYIPVRSTLKSFGITDLTFNSQDQTVTLNGYGISIPVKVENGQSYTTQEMLQSIGLKVQIGE